MRSLCLGSIPGRRGLVGSRSPVPRCGAAWRTEPSRRVADRAPALSVIALSFHNISLQRKCVKIVRLVRPVAQLVEHQTPNPLPVRARVRDASALDTHTYRASWRGWFAVGARIRQVYIKFRITARQAGRDTSPPANGRPAAQDSGVWRHTTAERTVVCLVATRGLTRCSVGAIFRIPEILWFLYHYHSLRGILTQME